MTPNPFTRRPYVDWRGIDRWKTGLIFLSFCLLMIGALLWPIT